MSTKRPLWPICLTFFATSTACSGASTPSAADSESSGSTTELPSSTSVTSAADTGTSTTNPGTSGMDTTDGSSSEDTGTPLPDGPWCGRTPKASRDLEGTPISAARIDSRGGPVEHVAWFGENWLRAAKYDLASDTWSDTETLLEGGVVGFPEGAGDPAGNTFVIHSVGETSPTIVVHRYDVDDDAWSDTTLDGVFEQNKRTMIKTTDDGDAVALVLDRHDLSFTAPFVASYDADSDAWSTTQPLTISSYESYNVPVDWAIDPTSGDAVIAIPLGNSQLELDHRDGATDTWSAIMLPTTSSLPSVVSTGAGEFAFVDDDRNGVEVHRFHDGDWGQPDVLATGELLSTAIAGAQDGRIAAAWFVAPARLLVSVFDPASDTWSDPEDANTELQGAQIDYAPRVAMTFDGDDLVVVWTQRGPAEPILSYGRRRTAAGTWEALGVLATDGWDEVDVVTLSSIPGVGVQTVAFGVESVTNSDYQLTCEVPGSQWSMPISVGADFERLDDRDDGGTMVFRDVNGSTVSAQYIAAP